MKKIVFCFMALLLSAGAVFAADGSVDNTRTPPPPQEETRMPPPPPPLNEAPHAASPRNREAGGTKSTAAAPKTSGAATSATAAPAATRSDAAESKTKAAAKTPSTGTASSKPAAPNIAAPKKPQLTPEQDRAARLKSIGVSVGTTLASPLVLATARVTIPPARNLFIELGFDAGGLTGIDKPEYFDYLDYFSMYPYAHVAYFRPFARKGGWYAGAGAGYMIQHYWYGLSGYFDEHERVNVFAVDFGAGLVLWNFLDLSYTIRTDFSTANHKISLGYIYRFK
jgi:hypothetical protein